MRADKQLRRGVEVEWQLDRVAGEVERDAHAFAIVEPVIDQQIAVRRDQLERAERQYRRRSPATQQFAI